jgi:hypothetical protein
LGGRRADDQEYQCDEGSNKAEYGMKKDVGLIAAMTYYSVSAKHENPRII